MEVREKDLFGKNGELQYIQTTGIKFGRCKLIHCLIMIKILKYDLLWMFLTLNFFFEKRQNHFHWYTPGSNLSYFKVNPLMPMLSLSMNSMYLERASIDYEKGNSVFESPLMKYNIFTSTV